MPPPGDGGRQRLGDGPDSDWIAVRTLGTKLVGISVSRIDDRPGLNASAGRQVENQAGQPGRAEDAVDGGVPGALQSPEPSLVIQVVAMSMLFSASRVTLPNAVDTAVAAISGIVAMTATVLATKSVKIYPPVPTMSSTAVVIGTTTASVRTVNARRSDRRSPTVMRRARRRGNPTPRAERRDGTEDAADACVDVVEEVDLQLLDDRPSVGDTLGQEAHVVVVAQRGLVGEQEVQRVAAGLIEARERPVHFTCAGVGASAPS